MEQEPFRSRGRAGRFGSEIATSVEPRASLSIHLHNDMRSVVRSVDMTDTTHAAPVVLPRIAITYCTQCKWLLRAAYFGQELLSTFGTTIGEIALIPATGGLFTVYLTHKPEDTTEVQEVLIWDRKAEGGFPETKILKQKVRNHISPEKKLGHSDTPSLKGSKPDALTTGDTADSVSALGTTSGAAGNDPLIAGAVATTNEGMLKTQTGDANGPDCEDCK